MTAPARRSTRMDERNPAIAVVAFAQAILFILLIPSAALAQSGGAPAVFATPARLDYFVDRIEALGTLRANETVAITATVTDTVTAVYFDDGARVNEGDTLLTMADTEERALLEEAEAASAEALRQLNRARSLVSQGNVSRSVLDERKRTYETAAARRRALQSRLEDRIITAPFAGVVGLRTISAGALVSPGDVITRLHDDTVMKLDFSVPSTYLSTLKVGLEIEATSPALDGAVFNGTISSLDNEIDPVTRSITVRAMLPNPDAVLRPGLLMSVELLKNPRETIVIPEEALVPMAQDVFVFVATTEGDTVTAERRVVTTGSRRPGEVEVLEGVAEGDLVITEGAQRLRPGQVVDLRAVDRKGDATLEDMLRPEDAVSSGKG